MDRPQRITATRSRTTARTALPALVAFAVFGCYESHVAFGDGDHDTHALPDDARPDVPDDGALPDFGTDADADGEADAVEDATPEVEADAATCVGGWYDPSSGLCWQDPPPSSEMSWYWAVDYCDALDLGGHGPGSWHLPTISELRSLIRGCPATEAGGPCGVTDTCLGGACCDDSCVECSFLNGPGTDGAYWSVGLHGTVSYYWSSSLYAGESYLVWVVGFIFGYVIDGETETGNYVRCVRRGP